MVIRERLLHIPVANRKRVKGFLRGSLSKPLVIFVHGLTGDPNEHQFYNGARYLERRGFASFRYHLYDSKPLRDATLKSHAADFDRVVAYFRKRSKRKLFAIGHSYGGATILFSKQKDIDGAVLWDPTHKPKFLKRLVRYSPALKAYLLRWQVESLVGIKMVDEAERTDWNKLGRDVTFPLKVITAEKGGTLTSRRYTKNAQGPTAYQMIRGASHDFFEDGKSEQLFAATVRWFRKLT